MTGQMGISDIKELIRMKKENPDEYKQLLEGMADISRDILGIVSKLTKELEAEED